MNEKRSCCCGVLPPLWWWLLALAGLGLLFWLMASNRRPVIEGDLATRTNQSLAAAGLNWAQAKLDHRGRDVILEGQAPDAESQQQAMDIAQKVNGVRVVEGKWGTALAAAGAAAGAAVASSAAGADAGKPAVDANASGATVADATTTSTTVANGADAGKPATDGSASSTTVVDTTTPAASADGVDAAKPAADANASGATVADATTSAGADTTKPTASATTTTDAAKPTTDATSATTGTTTVADTTPTAGTTDATTTTTTPDGTAAKTAGTPDATATAATPTVEAVFPSLAANMAGGKVTLEGMLPTQAQVDGVLAEAKKQFGAANVVNNLKVMSTQEADALKTDPNNPIANSAGWLTKLGTLFGLLPKKEGKLSVDQGIVTLAGMVPDDATRNSMITRANDALKDSGLNLLDRLVLDKGTQVAATDPAAGAAPNPAADPNAAQPAADPNATTQPATDPHAGLPAPIVGMDPAVKQPETVAEPGDIRGMQPTNDADRAALDCQTQLDQTMSGKEIQFATNKADIRPGSRPALNQIAKLIKSCNAALAGRKVRISGHTDSVGNPAYNVDLSQRRAAAVKTYLQKSGVPAGLLESEGFGAAKPIADNATEAGRAQNRRISFDIKAGG